MIFDKKKSIYSLFAEQVKKTPGAAAVECDKSQLTYRELEQKAGRIALKLSESGFKAGDLAALEFAPPVEMVQGILGILKAGGGFLPLHPRAPVDYIQPILRHSKVNYYLECSSSENRIQFPGKTLVYNDSDHSSGDDRAPGIEHNPENPLLVIYQSNSGGKPEGLSLSHKKVLQWLEFTREKLRVDFSRTLFISNLRMAMSFPLWLGNLVSGGSVSLYDLEDNDLLPGRLALTVKNGFTSVFCPLSFLEILARPGQYNDFLSGNTTNIVTVGEDSLSFNIAEFKAFIKNRKIPVRWHNFYGFPGINMITTLAADERTDKGDLIHIGKPAPETGAYVLSKRLELVPIGKTGELYIRVRYHGPVLPG